MRQDTGREEKKRKGGTEKERGERTHKDPVQEKRKEEDGDKEREQECTGQERGTWGRGRAIKWSNAMEDMEKRCTPGFFTNHTYKLKIIVHDEKSPLLHMH